jgi:hypothetical protein
MKDYQQVRAEGEGYCKQAVSNVPLSAPIGIGTVGQLYLNHSAGF